MTNEEILQKAIEKAEKNRFKNPFSEFELNEYYEVVIFSHEFAKAFWGEEKIKYWSALGNLPSFCYECDMAMTDYQVTNWPIAWKYHLSKMVLEKEPLKYLERFL